MEMKIYIANLGKYNEGELVGEWFTIPIDMEEVKKRIGLNEEYEEYAIHDYELPFDVGEFTPIWEINGMVEMILKLEGTPIYSELKSIKGMWFSDMDDLLDNLENIICYSDCTSMEDVAYSYVEDAGLLDGVPENLKNYIDYKKLGHDMETDGNYLITSNGVFEFNN